MFSIEYTFLSLGILKLSTHGSSRNDMAAGGAGGGIIRPKGRLVKQCRFRHSYISLKIQNMMNILYNLLQIYRYRYLFNHDIHRHQNKLYFYFLFFLDYVKRRWSLIDGFDKISLLFYFKKKKASKRGSVTLYETTNPSQKK